MNIINARQLVRSIKLYINVDLCNALTCSDQKHIGDEISTYSGITHYPHLTWSGGTDSFRYVLYNGMNASVLVAVIIDSHSRPHWVMTLFCLSLSQDANNL